MTIYIPEFIDEMIDTASDPLAILLAREGSNDEAYQYAVSHRAGQQQIVERSLIEDADEHGSDGEWIKRTRRLSSKTVITRKH